MKIKKGRRVAHKEEEMLIGIAIKGITALIKLCGDDPTREGMQETPLRFINAMRELTEGYNENPDLHLRKSFAVNDQEGSRVTIYDELILSGELPLVSCCEHHKLIFQGICHVGYIPNIEKGSGGRVVGLSKIARLVDGYSKRFQVQERLTRQIGDAMIRELNPIGVGVIIKARHTCQCFRGVKKDGVMTTSAMYGVLKTKPEAREEFLKLITL